MSTFLYQPHARRETKAAMKPADQTYKACKSNHSRDLGDIYHQTQSRVQMTGYLASHESTRKRFPLVYSVLRNARRSKLSRRKWAWLSKAKRQLYFRNHHQVWIGCTCTRDFYGTWSEESLWGLGNLTPQMNHWANRLGPVQDKWLMHAESWSLVRPATWYQMVIHENVTTLGRKKFWEGCSAQQMIHRLVRNGSGRMTGAIIWDSFQVNDYVLRLLEVQKEWLQLGLQHRQ